MAIENINAYSERWQNGVSVGAMWDKIKAKFVSGAHDQTGATAYPNTWKVQARVNLGLGNLAENSIWIGASGNKIGQQEVSTLGKNLLTAQSGTKIDGLFAEKAYRLDQASVGSLSLPVYVDSNGRVATITSLAVSGNVQSLQGGVSAMGIADLFSSVGGGGGGGTVTGVDFTQDVAYQQTGTYAPDDGIIHLPRYKWANIQDKPIVTTGSTNGTISYGGVDVAVYGLQALAYKASLTASDIPTIAISQVSGLQTALNNKLETSLKGAANGLAELDASQKIKLAQIPDVVLGQLVFGGTVNASGVATLSANAKTKTGITSNTVTLSNSAGTSSTYGWVRFEGCFFIMDADSSFASLDLKVGDWLLSTGTAWKKVDNTDAVTGVKGDNESSYRIGNVNITKANIGLGNVENTKLSTWAGTQNITTLGTITTGVWHGTKIANDYLANSTIYINGTSFTLGDSATEDKVTAVWGASRDITISDNDGTNTQVTEDVSGANNFTLKLPSTIKATLTGNASSATKLQTSRNIWGQPFNGTAEVSGNMSSVGNIAFNAGDHNIGSLLYFDMTNGRIGIGMSAPLEKLGVQGNMYATGGVAAYGISDLSQSGGGGGGLSGTILRDWSQYDGSVEANQILSSYLGIEQFRMSGQNFQFMRNKTWTTGFTLAEGNIPDLAIGKITGVQSLTIKGGTTSIGTYSPSSALEVSIVAGTNISVTPDATNHKITIANTYSLPTASSSTKGGVKVGNGLTISNEVLSVSGVTNDMLSGSIANGKLANSKVTIAGTDVSLGGSITAAQLQTNLGLGGAAYKAADYYVNSISWDSTNKKLAWSKGGTAQSAITIGYATDADTVDGHHASEFVGALGVSGSNLTWTKIGGTAQNITVPYATNAGTLGGVAKEGLFTVLENDNDQLSATIGTTNKKLTLDYAKKASRMRTEIKADQEFVYRQSPQTIDADSLVINKFKGRTVAWNQQFRGRPDGASSNGITISYNSSTGVYQVTGTATGNANGPTFSWTNNTFPNGHQVYIRVEKVSGTMNTQLAKIGCQYNTGAGDVAPLYGTNAGNGAKIITMTASYIVHQILDLRQGDTINASFRFINIDLTLFFNGNIPEDLTAETFERDYGYLFVNSTFNAGQLINNSAEGLETVGFNVWDEEWAVEQARVKTKNYIPVIPGSSYYLKIGSLSSGSQFTTYLYDNNKNLVQTIYPYASDTITIPSGVSYMYMLFPQAYGATYNHDICINLSDPSKNGTYEPYRKSTMPLNLNAIKVYSHNIWDEEWEVKQISGVDKYIMAKNYIPVKPSTKYYYRTVYSDNGITYYDSSYQTISSVYPSQSLEFTTPANCAYIKISAGGNSQAVTTYANNLCVNLSGAFNGQYEPHGILTIEGGLKSANAVCDEIVSNKLIKRVRRERFGNMTGYAESTYFVFAFSSSVPQGKANSNFNVRCDKYVTGQDADKTIYKRQAGNGVVVKDSSYSTFDALAAAIANNYFNYELATPIEYELVSPIPNTMPAGTTERIISDRLPVTPFACDMTYGTNPGDILASGIAWEKIWGRPQLAKGSYSDSVISGSGEWFKLDVGGQVLYVQFAVGTGAFRLKIADSDDEDAATVSKEFAFATLSESDINAICV